MEITPKLLKKYSNGDCSELEVKAVEQWLNCEGEFENENENIIVLPHIESKIWNSIKATKTNISRQSKRRYSYYKLGSVAASILVLIGITSYLWLFNNIITYNTALGELKIIVLEDGTKITLNAASTLSISKEFNKKYRTVTLDGEAFFEVAKDSLHPFIVTTNKSITKVLGTKFNLSAYKNENNRLTLNEGKVSFYKTGFDESSGVILSPNQQVSLNNGILVKKNVNAENYKDWVYKNMIFNNEPFVSITRKMERKYNVKIQIKKESLKKEFVKGSYKNPSLDSLLEDLSFVLKFKHKIDGNTIIIY